MNKAELFVIETAWCVYDVLSDGSRGPRYDVALVRRGNRRLGYIREALTREILVFDLDDIHYQDSIPEWARETPSWARHDPDSCKNTWRTRILVEMAASPEE